MTGYGVSQSVTLRFVDTGVAHRTATKLPRGLWIVSLTITTTTSTTQSTSHSNCWQQLQQSVQQRFRQRREHYRDLTRQPG